MPSFPRLGKHSNRSQHTLPIEHQAVQAQQQLQQEQQRAALQQQLHLQQQRELQQQQHQAQGAGSGGGAALPLSQPSSSAASPSQQAPGPRRVSAAGLGPDASHNPPSASPGPPSLSSNDSFRRGHPQQQQVDTRTGQAPQPSSQQQSTQSSPQQGQHHSQLSLHNLGLNLSNGPTREVLRKPNPNLPPPPAQGTTIPLNQPNPSSALYSTRQQQQQAPQARDNFAELVSRSQSARYSQVIPPLQTQSPFGIGIASSSVDDLSQTASGVPSPAHSQPQPQPAPEPKRRARNLIKNILGSSSSRPTSNHYAAQDQVYESTAPSVVRRPSKRSNNTSTTPRGSSLLARPIDHPDWVPPPAASSRHPQSHQSHSQQSLTQQSSAQHSPSQGVGDFDGSFQFERSSKDLLAGGSQEALPNTIRHVPNEVETSPYDHEDLAFHQQQAIAQHQAQLLQQQGQILSPPPARQQVDNQQQLYSGAQIVVDPAQSPYQQHAQQPRDQYQQHSNPPSVYTSHLTTETSLPPNPETVSQLSHDSPTSDSEQPPVNLQSAQDSPAVSQAPHDGQLSGVQQPPQSSPSQAMPPPPQQQQGPPGQGRRSVENDKMRSVEPPPGPPPNYRHSQVSAMNPLPPTPGAGNPPPGFRPSGAGDRQQYDGPAADERGRNSPQPSTEGRDADHDKQFKDLLTKYKNVKRLYFDGKAQIEQMTQQVEQLQNAVANQRMSQSRTALDDNEYSTRFNRLNGAINNLSFNIRKDWQSLPAWIERHVTLDAIKVGKQEMTAVGRAIISRWIVEEVFNKCFHPALDVDLSCSLKQIEQNIRRFSYTMSSQEEYDALTTKVVSWRMTTLEGLQNHLNSPESADHRADYTKMVTSNLTAILYQYLSDPPPAGVEGSASMIVELAVGIAANLPLESRDVAITYPMPGDVVQPDIMEPEKQALPPLPEPAEEPEDKDGDKNAKRDKTKSGMLTMLGGSTPLPASSRKGSTASILTDAATPQTATAAQLTSQQQPPSASLQKDPNRVRFAGFIAVEVRGRQVLAKAPIWTMG
ncbi:hypothetical protein GGR57DRAFT_519045 [Xylariaceae sp. FL1272]|nr:hypothetical protein GGR57DRAFT_519045 [Xylariaceae sp. FL1272]